MRFTRLPYRVDALDGLVRLQEALESAFDRPSGFEPGFRPAVYPPMEVSSDEDGYVIRLEVPGIAPENLTVEIHGQVLNLAGKREALVPVAGGRQEADEFARSFRLPEDADGENATASSEHGILTVRIPKHANAKPRQITVTS